MKKIFFPIIISGAIFSAFAEGTPSEAQCKQNVDASVSAAEMVAQQKNEEPKIKDLTIKEIREIEKNSGSCAALVEINKRTQAQ